MHIHVFEQFIVLINNHIAHDLASLVTDNHTFIDAQGSKTSGKKDIIEGWKQYFKMFPDYWITIHEVMERENIVYGFGHTSATYTGHMAGEPHNFWRLPTAFRAVINEEKIEVWQVYADTKIPFEIIQRNVKV